MDDLVSRQAAIDAADRADYTGLAVEDVKKVTDEVVKELKQLPSAQPEVLAHGEGELSAQPEKTQLSREDATFDCISRQSAIDAIDSLYFDTVEDHDRTKERIKRLSSAQPKRCEDCENFSKTRLLIPQPEIIRCKDCRWWDKYGDYDNGYCMAAKHGYWSEHWDISIRRTYKWDFYCADAEPKGEQE